MTTADDPRRATLDAYCRAFEILAPDRLDTLRALCTDDVRFVDPFNDVGGIDRFVAIFAHMYRTMEEPRFQVLDRALGAGAGFVRWRFTGRLRGRAVAIEGMSEVRFDPETGRVREHVDHWDAAGQVYARLPLVGGAVRALRRLFAAGV
jgi:steroid delta-isomerase